MTELEDLDVDADTAARVEHMTQEADADIDAEIRVNFRWGRAQVDTLKRAAAIYGVPYQTYLKMVALRAARADLEKVSSA